jgi:hypothetical protein
MMGEHPTWNLTLNNPIYYTSATNGGYEVENQKL